MFFMLDAAALEFATIDRVSPAYPDSTELAPEGFVAMLQAAVAAAPVGPRGLPAAADGEPLPPPGKLLPPAAAAVDAPVNPLSANEANKVSPAADAPPPVAGETAREQPGARGAALAQPVPAVAGPPRDGAARNAGEPAALPAMPSAPSATAREAVNAVPLPGAPMPAASQSEPPPVAPVVRFPVAETPAGEAPAPRRGADTPAPPVELRSLQAAAYESPAGPTASPRSAAPGPLAEVSSAAPATPAPVPSSPSAPDVPRLPEIRTFPGAAGWGEAVGERVVWMSGSGVRNAEIQLHPAEMGPVRVQVSVDEGSATVTFQAQHAQTREALEQALPRLREMLTEQGLSLGGASVSDQGSRGQREPGAEMPAEAAATALYPDTDAGAADDAGAGGRRQGTSLVDLFA